MASGGIHTVFKNGKWVNEAEGASRALSRHDTKAEAEARGREAAKKRKVEHHIHNKDGKIAQRRSYGSDPRRSKG